MYNKTQVLIKRSLFIFFYCLLVSSFSYADCIQSPTVSLSKSIDYMKPNSINRVSVFVKDNRDLACGFLDYQMSGDISGDGTGISIVEEGGYRVIVPPGGSANLGDIRITTSSTASGSVDVGGIAYSSGPGPFVYGRSDMTVIIQ